MPTFSSWMPPSPRRPSWDETWLDVAEVVARRGTCPRGKVGAVLVNDRNRLIASGYNGSPPGQPHCTDAGCIIGPDGGCQRAFHAEQNAIFFAGYHFSRGTTLYTTLSPCYNCAKLITTAGVIRAVTRQRYRAVEGMPDPIAYLEENGVVVDVIEKSHISVVIHQGRTP